MNAFLPDRMAGRHILMRGVCMSLGVCSDWWPQIKRQSSLVFIVPFRSELTNSLTHTESWQIINEAVIGPPANAAIVHYPSVSIFLVAADVASALLMLLQTHTQTYIGALSARVGCMGKCLKASDRNIYPQTLTHNRSEPKRIWLA